MHFTLHLNGGPQPFPTMESTTFYHSAKEINKSTHIYRRQSWDVIVSFPLHKPALGIVPIVARNLHSCLHNAKISYQCNQNTSPYIFSRNIIEKMTLVKLFSLSAFHALLVQLVGPILATTQYYIILKLCHLLCASITKFPALT